MEENSGAMIKLTSANYSIWKPRMEDVLYTKDLYLPIYGDTKKPQGTSDEDWKVTNRKAVALIRTWVDQSVFHHVAQETNAYELWTKLEAMYERKTAQNKASLIRRLVNLKYKDGRNVAEHMSDFQGLINQLSTMKLVLDEELQALLLLSSLPDSWETLVVTISNSALSGMITMDMVKDGMFNEEARRKEQGTLVDTEALVVQNRGRSRTRNSGGDRNKSKDRSRSKSRGKKSSTVYLMQAKLSKGEVNAIGDEASTELWHKRLGQMSEKGIQILARKALLPEVKAEETEQEVQQEQVLTEPPEEEQLRRSTRERQPSRRMEENSGAMIKLTSANDSIWKPRMEDVFYTKDLYLPIYGDTKKSQGTSDEDWKVTNRKAVALIRTWVDQSVFHHVAQEKLNKIPTNTAHI
ncbi:hypothetical protein RHSIM_Rhsim09G0133900 [Rhododendron simsii]|uniref:GAG-pre-integrase domain-containing protein n=1 Tax=Rhododendron simsii TaxID=118357 RepID=A0A834GJ68_RHOSS|nr:hypothetical protein RHSIM_Rhsim09G0133900 [Rhododendron simsii]